ncbi:MAG: hypothetical protein IJ481_03755 [Alphaproteobacteria bacterium]|nr:hypothetical protein [Alphaproteobacteria bacterium]
MKKIKFPRTSFNAQPLIYGSADDLKSTFSFKIGKSKKLEDIFKDELPDTIRLMCKIETKSEFQDIEISARYKIYATEEPKLMKFNIYNCSAIDMSNYISNISIKFESMIYDSKPCLQLENYLKENNTIFQKQFDIQNSSRIIENYIDQSPDLSNIIHTKSKKHPFAGYYYDGIDLNKIKQHFFYIGTGKQGIPYIRTEESSSGTINIINSTLTISESISYKIIFIERTIQPEFVVIYLKRTLN